MLEHGIQRSRIDCAAFRDTGIPNPDRGELSMTAFSLNDALQQFDATEANLSKLTTLWGRVREMIGTSYSFGAPPGYDDACRAFRLILKTMPSIGVVAIKDELLEYDAVGHMRLDAQELGDVDCIVSVEQTIDEQGRQLEEYGFALRVKRRQLIRKRLLALVDTVDDVLRKTTPLIPAESPEQSAVPGNDWGGLSDVTAEIGMLLGSESRPERWSDLLRHIRFGLICDFNDIVKYDWPNVKAGLIARLYAEDDPLPVQVSDLGALVAAQPTGPVATKLHWANLSDEEFERLLFVLMSGTDGYENPEWLQHTRAADKGRDLSVTRVMNDKLEGVRRQRIIIQCKHWLTKSVSVPDVSALVAQMKLWEPPRIDVLIIATTGRFSTDAVSWIEKHNQADSALWISMWPESHLENLLSSRPHLIGQFKLRQQA